MTDRNKTDTGKKAGQTKQGNRIDLLLKAIETAYEMKDKHPEALEVSTKWWNEKVAERYL